MPRVCYGSSDAGFPNEVVGCQTKVLQISWVKRNKGSPASLLRLVDVQCGPNTNGRAIPQAFATGRKNGLTEIGERLSLALELKVQTIEVYVVKASRDFAVAEVKVGCAGELDLLAGGSNSKVAASVGHRSGPGSRYRFPFSADAIELEFNAGEGVDELAVADLELSRSGKDGVGLGEAVGVASGGDELVDDGFVVLVPELVEPAADDGLIGLLHFWQFLPCSLESRWQHVGCM